MYQHFVVVVVDMEVVVVVVVVVVYIINIIKQNMMNTKIAKNLSNMKC